MWEDWRQRMKGDHVIPIEDWRTHYDLLWYVAKSDMPSAAALRVAGVDVQLAGPESEHEILRVCWPDEAAALRAWHAVGAPVTANGVMIARSAL